MAKTIVLQTPPKNVKNQPSADFIKSNFDNLIWQKGYQIIIEKSLKCPCKSQNANQLSTCKNCGGTGWAFINPVLTRAILTSMNMSTEYKSWSEENMGTVNISVMENNRLAFMDKITLIDAIGSYTEVRHISLDDISDVLFAYTSYNIKEIEYAGLYIADTEKYQRLILNEDYTFRANRFYLDPKFRAIFDQNTTDEVGTSVVLRYVHPPQYYVIDLSRDVMKSWDRTGKKEALIDLPLAAVGRRAHYVIDAENLSQTRLLDNSYIIDPCLKDIKIVQDLFDIINC